MATRVWEGGAPAVKQESRATPANVEVGDIFTLTINGRDVDFTATAATVANVTAGLTAAWNAAGAPAEHQEITATDQTTYVELLGDTAGVPFTVTGSAVNGGATDDQTLTVTNPTAATGPNHWDNASNWSGDTVPVSTDDVIVENSDIPILYGLDQNAVTLASLTVMASFTGATALIGLPRNNANGYVEYRDTYLKISATSAYLGLGAGDGSGRVKLDTGTNQTDLNVWKSDTGVEATDGIPAILWKGTHASNTATVNKGSVGIAFFGGETATLTTLNVGFTETQATDSDVTCGDGLTLTTLTVDGGTVELANDATTVVLTGGVLDVIKSAAITTFTLEAGTCWYRSTGTVTTLVVRGGATISYVRDNRPRTVTNCDLYENATLDNSNGSVTFTNGFKTQHTNLAGLNILMPDARTYTISGT